MTYEQITDLLEKGFTPEQITLLTTSAQPTQAEEDSSTDRGGEAPEATDNKLPSPDAEQEPEESAADNTEVLEAIADLKKTIQVNNVYTKSMEVVDSDAELEKAMSELIRPSFNMKGD